MFTDDELRVLRWMAKNSKQRYFHGYDAYTDGLHNGESPKGATFNECHKKGNALIASIQTKAPQLLIASPGCATRFRVNTAWLLDWFLQIPDVPKGEMPAAQYIECLEKAGMI